MIFNIVYRFFFFSFLLSSDFFTDVFYIICIYLIFHLVQYCCVHIIYYIITKCTYINDEFKDNKKKTITVVFIKFVNYIIILYHVGNVVIYTKPQNNVQALCTTIEGVRRHLWTNESITLFSATPLSLLYFRYSNGIYIYHILLVVESNNNSYTRII